MQCKPLVLHAGRVLQCAVRMPVVVVASWLELVLPLVFGRRMEWQPRKPKLQWAKEQGPKQKSAEDEEWDCAVAKWMALAEEAGPVQSLGRTPSGSRVQPGSPACP